MRKSRALTRTNYTVAEGSIKDVAQRENISIEQAFMNAEYIALVDVSGSMTATDSRGGQSRHDVAEEELKKLQAKYPGKLALVCFSSETKFVPSGIPDRMNGGTNLLRGLETIQAVDGAVKLFFVICDGQPDWGQEDECMALARHFTTPVNSIFVGPETDSDAMSFMRRLAEAGNGQNVNASEIGKLAEPFEIILLEAGEK
jgi:hypothetical protein